MWELVIIAVVSFSAAVLTFFSGFGLGTLLTPVFLLFFPVELAIALTGVVHFFNNLFKLLLVGRRSDRKVLIRFGIPAVIFAFVGALLLFSVPTDQLLVSYSIGGHLFKIYLLKLIIALLLVFFAILDLLPYLNRLEIEPKWLPVGGALSGFFGGLSGHQGALRSAFLIRAGMGKETFIGTAVVISTFVDFSRLGVYASRVSLLGLGQYLDVILVGTAAAITGAFIGHRLLKKVTLAFIQNLVAVLLFLLALALGVGLI